jgi:hypothetical protein
MAKRKKKKSVFVSFIAKGKKIAFGARRKK